MFSVEPSGNASALTSVGTPTSGWIILIHPDVLWNSPLAKTIRQYDFFDYAVHEALFLSDREETILTAIIAQIQHEHQANLDAFSQTIIVSQLELLLNYAQRFYQRQFITRQITNHNVLERLEAALTAYLNDEDRPNHAAAHPAEAHRNGEAKAIDH